MIPTCRIPMMNCSINGMNREGSRDVTARDTGLTGKSQLIRSPGSGDLPVKNRNEPEVIMIRQLILQLD